MRTILNAINSPDSNKLVDKNKQVQDKNEYLTPNRFRTMQCYDLILNLHWRCSNYYIHVLIRNFLNLSQKKLKTEEKYRERIWLPFHKETCLENDFLSSN